MEFVQIIFYLFSFILVAAAISSVYIKNTVFSVLSLILAFVSAASLFILIGAEFIAMLLIVVYVGAIAVLFLFVVMMLNIDIPKVKRINRKYLPIFGLFSIILLAEILLIIKFSFSNQITSHNNIQLPLSSEIITIKLAGLVLYTKYLVAFQVTGMILFVAMIGAIVLADKNVTKNLKKQNIFDQVNRNKKDSIEIVKVKNNEGLDV